MKRFINFINKHNKFLSIVIMLGAITFLSSCLKDTREDLSKSPPLVGFLFPNTGFYPASGGFVSSLPLAVSSTAQTVVYDSTSAYPVGNNSPLEIELSYTSFPQPYSVPVTVTVGIDSTEIPEIDSIAGSDFVMLPTGSYSLPDSGQVTIQPVQLGNYPVAVVSPRVITSMLDPTKNYILPLKIIGAPAGITISTNLYQAAIAIVLQ